MWWNPQHFEKKRPALETRARIAASARRYFTGQKFTEVDTPLLATVPGPEPHLTPFVTEYQSPHGEARPLYLVTSPEIACKKLLAAGMERIFQLSHVFRNAETSHRHHPEFTMLEWYRTGAGYAGLMKDCENLLRIAAREGKRKVTSFNGIACDLTQKPVRISVEDAFRKYAGFSLLDCGEDVGKLAQAAKTIGIRTAADDRFDDIVLRVLGERVEPQLGRGAPAFLCDYPVSMAALAAPHPEDPRLARRFELYVCGLELANGFVELTDAAEQRRRFKEDRALQKSLHGKDYPLDEDFLKALEQGLPPCAGIALGFDRLIMLATGAEHIEEVLWAPLVGREE